MKIPNDTIRNRTRDLPISKDHSTSVFRVEHYKKSSLFGLIDRTDRALQYSETVATVCSATLRHVSEDVDLQ